MNETEVLAALEELGGLQRGHFKLSSGRHSDVFLQTALMLSYPGIAERLGHELGRRFEDAGVDVVLSPAVAGIVIGHEVARYMDVRHVFCERVEGRMTLRRGFELHPKEKVLLVDNAVTDGGSKLEVMELARAKGAEVVGVGIIADRSGGASLGVRLESLARMDTQEWDPEGCPLCRQGMPLASPGSRHL